MCVCVCVYVCSGMQACLCGCLTDLVSKTEVGQKVNRSRMEQIEKEWLSNHPNHFSFFFFTILPCMLQLCCFFGPARKCWKGSVWGGGRVRSPCCWPLGWEDRGETLGPLSQPHLFILLFASDIWFTHSPHLERRTVLPF